MRWFPGLFTIGELQEMDQRLSAYWLRQTEIQALNEQLRMTLAARLAQTKDSDYRTEINKMRNAIADLSLSKTAFQEYMRKIYDRNWDTLRVMAKVR